MSRALLRSWLLACSWIVASCSSGGPEASSPASPAPSVAASIDVAVPAAPSASVAPPSAKTHEDRDASVAFQLVVDRSGSMTGLPMDMAKSAAVAAVKAMADDDLFGLIVFDSAPQRVTELTRAADRDRVETRIQELKPGGGTEILSALKMALTDLQVVHADRKQVLLLTDGMAPTAGIDEVVAEMVARDIHVSAIALGDSADEKLMRRIAEMGQGRIYIVPDPKVLPRIFTEELRHVRTR